MNLTNPESGGLVPQSQARKVDTNVLCTAVTTRSRVENSYELDRLLKELSLQEAKRFSLSPERYDYSCLNTLYSSPDPAHETSYLTYDPGDGLLRGIIGNAIGPALKREEGIDLGGIFSDKNYFAVSPVLTRFPGVDVGGYQHFHAYLDVLNAVLTRFNLLVAYVRHDNDKTFRNGYYDHLGLIESVPGKGRDPVTIGDVEMFPVKEIQGGKILEIPVQGSTLYMAPFASCNWSFSGVDGLSEDEIRESDSEEVPVRDRSVDTFHFLNGVTPQYFRKQLVDGMNLIRHHLRTTAS